MHCNTNATLLTFVRAYFKSVYIVFLQTINHTEIYACSESRGNRKKWNCKNGFLKWKL